MDRRRYVRSTGASVLTLLAGCSSRGTPGDSYPTETDSASAEASSFTLTSTGDVQITRNDEAFADAYPDEKPFTEVVVGQQPDDLDNPPGIRISVERDASVDLRVSLKADSEVVFEGEGVVEPGAYLAVAVWARGDYQMAIEAADLHREFSITADFWDARSAQYNVSVTDDEITVHLVGAG